MCRCLCIITFLLASQVCSAEELTIAQLIAGANQSRNSIKSGEMRIIATIEDNTLKKSQEEIQAWIEEEKKEILKHVPAEMTELRQRAIDSLPFQAKQFLSEYREIEESNVAFQIFDEDSVYYSKAFQYKTTQIDRRLMDMYSEEAKHLKGGYFKVITYDGQTQVYEAISEFPRSSVSFANEVKYGGFLNFQLHGRSLNRIPSNAKVVGRETIEEADCYVLEFQAEVYKTDVDVKVWVDPQKQFCVRREERLENGQTPVLWEKVYEKFKNHGEVWFPSMSQWTLKVDGKVNMVNTMRFKEVQFNLDFPADFFEVNSQPYLNQGLRLRPDSQVSLGRSGQQFRDESPKPDPLQSDEKLLLSCGPNSLLRICELLKVDASFDELASLSGFNSNVGTTMLGLLQAAEFKHLNPKGIKANVKRLNKVPMPAIAYVRGNHFLVFEKATPNGVLIFDPAKKYDHYLASKELSEIWAGELLIFDYKPEVAKSEPVPRVQLDSRLYDFGEALGGSEIKYNFRLKNIGNNTLNLLKIEAPCQCTATIISKNQISPGGYGIIEATYTIPSKNGEVEQSFYAYTNDPTQTRIPLTFKGTAFVPIETFPNRILFGRVELENKSTKTLTVHRGPGKNIQINGVRVNTIGLAARILSKKESTITRVEVAILESMPIGLFKRSLLIDYSFEGKKATHTVEIMGEVLGEFEVSSQNLFFGLIKDKVPVSKTVTISSNQSRPFEITKLQSESKYVTAKVTPLTNQTGYHLTATIDPQAFSGQLSGEILVKTDSGIQPTIRIRFFGVIPGKK